MADYSLQIEDLKAAAEICQRHVITTPVNGIQPEYPRWPNEWVNAGCEVVWHWFLESKTISPDDDEDRRTVIDMANRLPR